MNFKELYFEQCPMNVNEVMQYLGIKRTTLHKFIHEQGLPHVRMGKNLRFWKKDVDAWLNGKRDNETKHNKTF